MKSKRLFELIVMLSLVMGVIGRVSADNVSAKGNESYWHLKENYSKNAKLTIDTENVYKDSAYSFKLENADFNGLTLRKKVDLKANTKYRFSAYVKYSGYEAEKDKESGACLGIISAKGTKASLALSEVYNKGSWKELSCEFTTPSDSDFFELYIGNGSSTSKCKGTAWFSDIKLEECQEKTTDTWNILVLVIKNIDADALIDGEMKNFKGSFTDADVTYLKKVVSSVGDDLKTLSDSKIKVQDIDVYTSDTVVTKLVTTDKNRVDPANSEIANELDKYLNKKSYQQIILFVPLDGANKVPGTNGGWAGKGGSKYNGINYCQCIHKSGSEDYSILPKLPNSYIIHEINHGLESDSKAIDPNTPSEHDVQDEYKKAGISEDNIDGYYECYHAYLTSTLSDGRGINPKAFYRPMAVKTILVSDDMTLGSGFGVSLKKATVKVKNNILKWSKIKGATGYEIYYSIDGSKYSLLTETSGKSYKLSKLENGSYKFKVRSYINVDEEKVYAKWSKVVKYRKKGSNNSNTFDEAAFAKKAVDLKLNNLVFSWEKIDEADAYIIRYKVNENEEFQNTAATTGCSYDIGKRTALLQNAQIYIQVVAYKDTDNGRVFSAGSKVYCLKFSK